MSFTHRSPGPVANVEALLPGKDDILILSGTSKLFLRAPRVGYIHQENGIIHHRIEGILTQFACFPLSCHPRTHSPYTVCVAFDKSVLSTMI